MHGMPFLAALLWPGSSWLPSVLLMQNLWQAGTSCLLSHRKTHEPVPTKLEVGANLPSDPRFSLLISRHLKGYLNLFSAGKGMGIHSMLSILSRGILTKGHIWSIYSPALLRLWVGRWAEIFTNVYTSACYVLPVWQLLFSSFIISAEVPRRQ